MAGDRIQINSLERALSEDINDLQAMRARTLNDWIQSMQALRLLSNSGGAFDTLPVSTTMGLDIRGNTTAMLIGPGILSQFSSGVLPLEPLDSAQRLGIQRGTVSVPIPSTPSRSMILEAQVVDVTTVSETRDVFDVPTQTFIPTLLVKQVERQIQYQIVQGAGGFILPPFTGDPWVPLYIFDTDGSGEVPVGGVPADVAFFDCRNDMKDIMGDDPIAFTSDPAVSDTYVESWALHSDNGGLATYAIGGNFKARQGSFKAWLKSDPTVVPGADSLVTAAGNAVEHIYLMPLVSNGITVFPVFRAGQVFGSPPDVSKGILVRSGVSGDIVGPDNSATITFDPAGVFQNFDPVVAHRAIYCATAYSIQAGGKYLPFTQSSGGRCMIRNPRSGTPNGLINRLVRATAILAGTENVPLLMAGFLPNGARTAILNLRVFVTPGTTATARMIWRFEREVGGFDFTGSGTVSGSSAIGDNGMQIQLEIPVHESSLEGVLAGFTWNVQINGTDDPVVSVNVDIVGWTF